MVVLRHGTSRPRDSWARADADRPLVSAGRRQARGLVELLAAWAPERILSSPWRRCLETVAPFAAAAGMDVRSKNALSEAGARRSPRADPPVRPAASSRPAARSCCARHRPVLAEVFDVVRDASEPAVAGGVPIKDPYLAPGEVLVAHVAPGLTPTGGWSPSSGTSRRCDVVTETLTTASEPGHPSRVGMFTLRSSDRTIASPGAPSVGAGRTRAPSGRAARSRAPTGH